MIHDIVSSDWFSLVVGIAGITAAFAAVIAVSRINSIITNNRQDSNNIGQQTQSANGNNIVQAGKNYKG